MAELKNRVTDEATSSPREIREAAAETCRVKVGRLVFAIRRIPTGRVDDILDRAEKVRGQSIKVQLDYQREIGQLAMDGLGAVSFGEGPVADTVHWDELPLAIQRGLVVEILAFTVEGTEEVAQALSTFPRGTPGADIHEASNGAAGEGHPAAGSDRGEAPASMAGDAAER